MRLVKVALPNRLVESMDEWIDVRSGYESRQNFITDAVSNLIVDLEMARSGEGAHSATEVSRSGPSKPGRPDMPQAPSEELREACVDSELAALRPLFYPEDGLLRTPPPSASPSEPTWGMHNRDYPTLWAAGMLARELDSREQVGYYEWLTELTSRAWHFARCHARTDLDTSGFPSNVDKRDKAETRFARFFVGEAVGSGPLFDLGLAVALENDQVCLSSAAAELLAGLEGWSPSKDLETDEGTASMVVSHLAAYAPADFDFLHRIVSLIDEGVAVRSAIVEAIQEDWPNWSEQMTATNVAGFIGRAKQLGLVEVKQRRRQYILTPWAADLLRDTAETERM